jgi:hypothetical protein
MRTTVLLAVGWVLLAALPAHAELKGVRLYERGDYGRARKALEEDLRSRELSKEERIKARLYLAAALHASGAEEAARIQLEELALTAPGLQVDPILFPPDFVELAERSRKQVEAQREAAENQRLAAERQRLEDERKRLDAEARAKQPLPPDNPPLGDDGEEPEGTVQLRPELFGFMDPLGKAVGFGGGLTLGLGAVDLNARVVMGKAPGVGAEVGLLVGDGTVKPRLALRGTAIPGVPGFGGGAVVGLRVSQSRLTWLFDVGAEFLSIKREYRNFVLSGSAGVGFDLL